MGNNPIITTSAVLLSFLSLLCAARAEPGAMRDMTGIEIAKEMSPGWNLGNTLEALPDETSWGNPRATQGLFDAVAKAGFKSVRIPISWAAHTDTSGNIDESWMERIAEVVGYARKAGLYVLINEHWDRGWLVPTYAKQEEANARLAKLWTQIAVHFRDYDDHLLFAGTNEVHIDGNYDPPTAENAAVQNGFNQVFVDAARKTGGNNTKRILVVQSYNTNIDAAITHLKLPTDTIANRMMVEVHFYDPSNFTINDKSTIWQWGAIATDPKATESWANEAYVDAQFAKMKTRFIDKGYAVILGEYSAVMRAEYSGHERYRAYWNLYVTRSAAKHGLVPMYWDNGYTTNHASGLFHRKAETMAYPEMIEGIVKMAQEKQ